MQFSLLIKSFSHFLNWPHWCIHLEAECAGLHYSSCPCRNVTWEQWRWNSCWSRPFTKAAIGQVGSGTGCETGWDGAARQCDAFNPSGATRKTSCPRTGTFEQCPHWQRARPILTIFNRLNWLLLVCTELLNMLCHALNYFRDSEAPNTQANSWAIEKKQNCLSHNVELNNFWITWRH